MGLGIHKDGGMTVYTIPLMGGEDNTWLTEHLRQLARKIEESRFSIISIVLKPPMQPIKLVRKTVVFSVQQVVMVSSVRSLMVTWQHIF